MKRLAIVLLFTAFAAVATAQGKYVAIDSKARSVNSKTNNILKIHGLLTEGLEDDESKVRAFYVWICENISYNYPLFEDRKGKLKLANQPLKKQLKRTLKKRRAICGGYSQLFREFCRLSDIHAEIEVGYGKTSVTKIGLLGKPDHAWNKVMIDGDWKLIDATWGSGGVYKGVFTKNFDGSYFFSPAHKFYVNHYPKNSTQEIIGMGITKSDFANFPLVGRGFFTSVESLNEDSKIGLRTIGQQDTLTVSFKKGGPIGVVIVYNREKELSSFQVEKEGDWHTVKIWFDQYGIFHPAIYFSSYHAFTYKVKVVKNR